MTQEAVHISLVMNSQKGSCKKTAFFQSSELMRLKQMDSKCIIGVEQNNSQQLLLFFQHQIIAISTIIRALSLNLKYFLFKLEQHIGHSTILVNPTSLPFAKLYGPFRVVNSFRCRESYRNALSFGKARSIMQ